MLEKYPDIFRELKTIEEYIKKNTSSRNRFLEEVVSELVEAGGKRLRPAMVILSARFGEYDREKAVSAAAAVEVLHTATLVHDDIIDRSRLRRGKPTVSGKYGVDMAVYTGDFLFTKAMLMLSRGIPAEKLDIAARALKSICEGEVDQYLDRFNFDITAVSYLKRISRKTAVLFSTACGLGAVVGGCSDDISRNLARFGFCYGMAFQMRDDLNDISSTSRESGKPVGNDIKKGVVTLPVIYAISGNPALKSLLSGFSEGKGAVAPADIGKINDLVRAHRGIEKTEEMLGKYIERGRRVLEKLPDNQYRAIFEDMISGLRTT